MKLPIAARIAALSCVAMLCTAAAGAPPAPPSGDERMIFVDAAFVVTFDASTVVIAGSERRARMHIYLPTPDGEGYASFDAAEQIDCKRGMDRYTDAIGRTPNGDTTPMISETQNFRPIVGENAISVLRDHLCALTDLRKGAYGVPLQVPGDVSARAASGLLKIGLEAKPAAQLASQDYGDAETLAYELEQAKVEPARRADVIAALGPLVAEKAKPPPPIVPLPSAVATGRAGQYLHDEMELAAGLWLKVDGTFAYFLTVGSLDETASGRWTADGGHIKLVSVAPIRRTDIDPSSWRVTSDGHTLTITREGRAMTFVQHSRQ